MGLGDWIMATSQVRELNERTGKRIMVVDRMGRVRWSDAFDNNPRVVPPGEVTPGNSFKFVRLLNSGGARPYIRAKTDRNWYWQTWNIQPGELFLTDQERDPPGKPQGDYILIEPNTKVQDGNKAWPFDRWQRLLPLLPLPAVQIGSPLARRLPGALFVETTVRHAFGMIQGARLVVSTEGALHHAAAALGTPAVVLWSEFISPVFTGYRTQRNIRKTAAVCGSRMLCKGCRASMEAITVEEVQSAILEELAK